MTLFERIENLRKAKGISQGKLEKELEFSNGSISKWKNSTPNPDRLKKIADYFAVSVDYLITGKEKEIPDVNTTDDFVTLIDFYNSSNEDGKKRIMEYAKMISKEYKK